MQSIQSQPQIGKQKPVVQQLPDSLKQKKLTKKILNTEQMPPKPVVDEKASNEKPPALNKPMQLLVP